MRRDPRLVVLALCVVSTSTSTSARPAKRAPTLTPDQQEVVTLLMADTFPRPKREPLTLALCLDVQVAPIAGEDAPAPPVRRDRHQRPHPHPPNVVVRGAPAELIARLARPWRLVASAADCRLDADHPIALPDARHTRAQLVTVHLAPDAATGTIKIDWTPGPGSFPSQSRDCTASRGPRGWSVQCGGTWFQ